jgi:ribosome-associated protein
LASTVPSRGAESGRPQRSLQVALAAAEVAHDNRGQNIVLLDLREMTAVFDYFLLVTGTSSRQLHAIAEDIDRILAERFGERRLGVEGYAAGTWILQDYGDVVVHLFDEQARDYYALEQLWSGARRVELPQTTRPRIAGSE